MAATGGGGNPAVSPSGPQCAAIALYGAVAGAYSAHDLSVLSALTGIPPDQVADAAFACGHNAATTPGETSVGGTPIPGTAPGGPVANVGGAAGGAAAAIGGTFSGLAGAFDAFGKGIMGGSQILLVAGGIIILALVLRK